MPALNSTCYRPMNFTSAPNMDLQGTLLQVSLVPSAAACLFACCNAPACAGAAFDRGAADAISGYADCFLYANVTQLLPSSTMSSVLYGS